MKTFLLSILTLTVLNSCNWAVKVSNDEQVFESNITIIPVEDYKK